jgi:hypothetical protein
VFYVAANREPTALARPGSSGTGLAARSECATGTAADSTRGLDQVTMGVASCTYASHPFSSSH